VKIQNLQNENTALKKSERRLAEENLSLQLQIENYDDELVEIKDTCAQAQEANRFFSRETANYKFMVDALNEEIAKLKEENRKYTSDKKKELQKESQDSFGRQDVVQLSQLIARYLENKPKHVDSNKIFNSISNCYRDLSRGYNDNPKHFYMDMRMLLTTCAASTWFSSRQRDRIRCWLAEKGWN
jgi:chromosome segregation ATPase